MARIPPYAAPPVTTYLRINKPETSRAGLSDAGRGHICGIEYSISIIHMEKLLETTQPAGRSWLWLLLLIPYIALLWLPFYNDTHPSFAGFPFFYWYQFLWVPLTSLLIYVVYRGLK
jgi:hypothetical protein